MKIYMSECTYIVPDMRIRSACSPTWQSQTLRQLARSLNNNIHFPRLTENPSSLQQNQSSRPIANEGSNVEISSKPTSVTYNLAPQEDSASRAVCRHIHDLAR